MSSVVVVIVFLGRDIIVMVLLIKEEDVMAFPFSIFLPEMMMCRRSGAEQLFSDQIAAYSHTGLHARIVGTIPAIKLYNMYLSRSDVMMSTAATWRRLRALFSGETLQIAAPKLNKKWTL